MRKVGTPRCCALEVRVTRAGGFTLVEMLVAVAILAIVLMVAVPDMSRNVSQTQGASASDGLVRAAANARALAVQSGRRTSLQVNTNSASCGGQVAWAIVQGSTAVGCLTQADFNKRYRGATISGTGTEIVYSPTGIANQLTSDLVYEVAAGSITTQVRINAGGTTQIL